MAIKELIPIDITFPTRVAMELKKRGMKDVDPKQVKVTAVCMVLIAETFKLKLIKKVLPPPLPKHLTTAQFRHAVVKVERWIKAIQKQIEFVKRS